MVNKWLSMANKTPTNCINITNTHIQERIFIGIESKDRNNNNNFVKTKQPIKKVSIQQRS